MNEQRSSPRPFARFPTPTEVMRTALDLVGAVPVPHKPRALLTWLVLTSSLAMGCAGEASVCDSVKGDMCNQCYGDVYTCTYDEVSVTTRACEGCQARFALYDELCALGRTDSRAEVDAAMVCEIADTGAR